MTDETTTDAELSLEKLQKYASIIVGNLELLQEDSKTDVVVFEVPFDFLSLSPKQKETIVNKVIEGYCTTNKIIVSRYLHNVHVHERMSELLHMSINSSTSNGGKNKRVGILKSDLINRLGDILLAGMIEKVLRRYYQGTDLFPDSFVVETKNTAIEPGRRPSQQSSTILNLVDAIIEFYNWNIRLRRLIVSNDGFHLELCKTMTVTTYSTITNR